MKLRTSFFNVGVLRKNLTRFAPLWILYAVGEVLGLMMLDLDNAAYQIANDLNFLMGPTAIFHAGYAFLAAACLFGDLFDSRLCNGLHAMPMRRAGWLITNLLSGLIFALIPAVVGGGVAALFLGDWWWFALVWQGVSLLQFVFFFGLAVFSAMCAGKRLGMIAIYGILNFLAMLVYWIATNVYEPLLPGVVISDYWFAKLTPLVSMMGSTYLDYYYDKILGGFFRGFIGESWSYLLICAGMGLMFTLLAWLVYRKRNLETAGDFISFRPMRVFFLLTYTCGLGVLLYTFGDLLGLYRDYCFLVVGLIIGWFTGWMLLERTVKIFTKKVLVSFAAFALLFAGSIGLTLLDPAGIVTYIPRTEQIAEANLYLQNDVFYYHSDDDWGGRHITDPTEIQIVQELHGRMIETPEDPEDEYVTVYVRYRLHNGRIVYRTYKVPAQSDTAKELQPVFSDPRSVFSTDDWQQIKDNVKMTNVYMDGTYQKVVEIMNRQQMQALLAAIEADCEAGTFTQHDYFHTGVEYVAGIDISWDEMTANNHGDIRRAEHVVVYADSVNTVAFLETLEKD